MRILTMAALVASQVAAAQPAFAAAIQDEIGAGTFGGLRIRMPLGPDPERRGLSAGLTLAPTLQMRGANGALRTRFGEGLEFGFGSRRQLGFSVAGRDLGRHRLGAAQDDDGNGGVPTWAIVAGGAALLAGGALLLLDGADDCRADEVC